MQRFEILPATIKSHRQNQSKQCNSVVQAVNLYILAKCSSYNSNHCHGSLVRFSVLHAPGTKANQSLPEAKAEETSEVALAQKFPSQFMEITKSFFPDNNCTNLMKLASFKTKKYATVVTRPLRMPLIFLLSLLNIAHFKKTTTQALHRDG